MKYNKLPGGGIEQGENLYEALDREIMEEVGTTIKNIRNDKPKDYLGTYVQIRDVDIIEYSMRNHEKIKQLSDKKENVR